MAPLTDGEQADERYVAGRSCPYCFKTPAARMNEAIAARHLAIARVTTPLPGSVPRDNYRPINVSQHCAGATLVEALCYAVKHLPAAHWEEQCRNGMVVDEAHNAVAATRSVRAGERYLHRAPAEVEPDVNAGILLLHEDEALVVLHKPAPLPMHPAGRFHRNTLQYILEQVYRPQKPRPAHRLDANTTGLVVVARTQHFAGKLQPQFAAGQVVKHYLVRVQGHPADDAFDCDAPISAESAELGTRSVSETGLAARTKFRVRQRCSDGSSILEAQPLSGRTNQIRIHCAHLGHPVRGDQAYRGGNAPALTQTAALDDPPLCLHAWKIAFRHPATGLAVEFEAPPPDWAG
jgi:RluA family pseudouridine synthase